MATERSFRLIEVDPAAIKRGRPRTTLYHDIMTSFLKSGSSAAEVADTGRRPATLVAGLKQARAELSADVKVSTRGDKVFLLTR